MNARIGYVSKGIYSTYKNHHEYTVWKNMLNRVYNPKSSRDMRTYSGVTVNPIWYNFQNFASWYTNETKLFSNVDFTWHLDKDLLFPGNRIYSPDFCCLVPHPINELLNSANLKRGNLPLGVTLTKNRKSYAAQCNSQFGHKKWIGTYPTVADAQRAYWSAKFQVIQSAAIRYWQYLPEPLAWRLLTFDWSDAHAYYGDDAIIRF